MSPHTPRPAWRDETLPPRERAAALLAEMTIAERLQQLGSTWPNAEGASGDVAPMQDTQTRAAPFDDAIKDGLGQLTRVFGTAPIEPEAGMSKLRDLQRAVVAANRFGVPAVAHEECLTGFTAWKATVYPTSLAWAATFDTSLIEQMGTAIGRDMAAVGIHQGLSPVLDVVRDYRWGRVEETMGEDPYLVGELAAAYVRGLQSAGVVATLKHFAGYAASRGARNHAPVSVGPRELADVILPPFEKAVVAAGVRSVMNAYNDNDGIPAAVDASLLTDLLRNTWGFEGTVVSDYWAIPFVHSMHKVAADDRDAAAQTLLAGIDVELPHTLGYDQQLLDDPQLHDAIDAAALRVLTQKAELGLLDEGWESPQPTTVDLDSADNRALARTIAEQSVVLLRNDAQSLPLSAPRSIAVIGPGADDAGCLFGCYSFVNHVVPNHPGLDIGVEAPTVLDALRAEYGDAIIGAEQGVPILGGDDAGIDRAVALATQATTTILVVGDRSGMFGHGTSGEGCDAEDLRLPGRQGELVERVLAASDDVILVVLSGRPYAIGAASQQATATLQVFFPGEEGASAIAGVISGRVNPSGKLPVQIPGDRANQPGTYLAPPLALRSDGVSNLDPSPAYPFGHGLSYTDFDVDDLAVSASMISTDGSLTISTVVRNSGQHRGRWVGQLYLSDPVASVTRPVRALIAFVDADLAPGESASVEIDFDADLSSFTGRDGRRRVEAGELTLTLASSAADAGAAVTIHLTGDDRLVDHTRTLTADTRVGREPRN
jgi:beta-glucosidase